MNCLPQTHKPQKIQMLVVTLGSLLTLGIVMTACSGPSSHPHNNVISVQGWKPEQVAISCPSGDCPQGVGSVVFGQRFPSNKLLLSRCTASLIGTSQVMTNSHCDKFLDPDFALFFVPTPSGGTEFIPLAQKVYDRWDIKKERGPDVGLGGDIAIFNLSRAVPELVPRRVSRHTPSHMGQLIGYMINDTYESDHFSFRKLRRLTLDREACHTVAHDPVREGGADDLGIGLELWGCKIIPGNSGSPLFANGDMDEIQVVVNAQSAPMTGESTGPSPSSGSFAGLGFGFGNRVQCMDFPGLAGPDKHCQQASLKLPPANPSPSTPPGSPGGSPKIASTPEQEERAL